MEIHDGTYGHTRLKERVEQGTSPAGPARVEVRESGPNTHSENGMLPDDSPVTDSNARPSRSRALQSETSIICPTGAGGAREGGAVMA